MELARRLSDPQAETAEITRAFHNYVRSEWHRQVQGTLIEKPLDWHTRAVAQAPDFDGDTRGDLVMLEQHVPGTSVSVLRGRGGSTIWRRDFPGYFLSLPYPVENLGRGKPGVIVFHYTFGANAVEALDANGNTLWVRPYPGATMTIGGGVAAAGAINIAPIAVGLAEANIVPGADVAIGSIHGAVAAAGGLTETIPSAVLQPTLFTVEVLDGYTGSPSIVAATPSEGSLPGAAFAGDLSGDGLDDLVLGAPTAVGSTVLTAWRADAPDAPLWATTFGNSSKAVFLFPAGKLDGDNRPDVIAWQPNFEEFAWTGSTAAFSGSDGRLLHLAAGDRPVAQDLDGDGWNDLRVFRESSQGNRPFISVVGLRGFDGRPLYSVTHPADESFTWLISDAGDVNADGVIDGTFGWSSSTVFSGATGEALWSGPRALPMRRNLDSVPGDDLMLITDEYFGESAYVTALNGLNGSTIWTRTITAPEGYRFGGGVAIPVEVRNRIDVVLDFNIHGRALPLLPVPLEIKTLLEIADGATGQTRFLL